MAKIKARRKKGKKEAVVEEETKFYESAEVLQEELSKSQAFVEKHKNLLTGIVGGLVLLVAGIFFYRYTIEQKNKEAQDQLFPAVFYFEKDSLEKAMQGDGNFTDGFEHIAENYGSTESGNLAAFYAGFSALKAGNFDQAIDYLRAFSSSDYLVQARAYALLGDAHMENKDFPAAAAAYKKASTHYPNEQFTPLYLLKLAMAYEEAEKYKEALSAYETILDKYKKTTEASEAKKRKAALAGKK